MRGLGVLGECRRRQRYAANAVRRGIDIKQSMEAYGLIVALVFAEVELGVGACDTEGEDLDGLAVEEVSLLPFEFGFGRGIEHEVKHGAEFAAHYA